MLHDGLPGRLLQLHPGLREGDVHECRRSVFRHDADAVGETEELGTRLELTGLRVRFCAAVVELRLLGLDLRTLRVEEGLLGIQLLERESGRLRLCAGLVELRLRGIQLCRTGIQLRLSGVELRPRVGELRAPRFDLLLPVGALLLGREGVDDLRHVGQVRRCRRRAR